MRFENPANGYVEEVTAAPLWCLLFGCIYFAVKGVWTHAVAALLLAIVTAGISWLIYPFFATQIMRTHHLRRGWIEIDQHQQKPIISGAAQARSSTGRNSLLTWLVVLIVIGAASVWYAGIHDTTGHSATASNSAPSTSHGEPQLTSLKALAQNVPPCRQSGTPAKLCLVKFGQVKVQLENNSDKSLKRAVVFSDDMKRDATDFTLAAGFLMLTISPHSTPDERGGLLKTLMVASKSGTPTKWSGYTWQLDYSSNDAIRIVAER